MNKLERINAAENEFLFSLGKENKRVSSRKMPRNDPQIRRLMRNVLFAPLAQIWIYRHIAERADKYHFLSLGRKTLFLPLIPGGTFTFCPVHSFQSFH